MLTIDFVDIVMEVIGNNYVYTEDANPSNIFWSKFVLVYFQNQYVYSQNFKMTFRNRETLADLFHFNTDLYCQESMMSYYVDPIDFVI